MVMAELFARLVTNPVTSPNRASNNLTITASCQLPWRNYLGQVSEGISSIAFFITSRVKGDSRSARTKIGVD